jgi:hypothetical protein
MPTVVAAPNDDSLYRSAGAELAVLLRYDSFVSGAENVLALTGELEVWMSLNALSLPGEIGSPADVFIVPPIATGTNGRNADTPDSRLESLNGSVRNDAVD